MNVVDCSDENTVIKHKDIDVDALLGCLEASYPCILECNVLKSKRVVGALNMIRAWCTVDQGLRSTVISKRGST